MHIQVANTIEHSHNPSTSTWTTLNTVCVDKYCTRMGLVLTKHLENHLKISQTNTVAGNGPHEGWLAELTWIQHTTHVTI
jgi:hypothetical protein